VASAAVVILLGLAGSLSMRIVRRRREEVMADQERRLATLGQMAGVMAHELRNPLTSLKGHAQLLAEMVQGRPRELAKAEVVVREAERLQRLTEDLLAFIRDGSIAPEEVPTSELFEHALRDVASQRVDLDLTDAPPSLHVDKVRISSAISNLVRNALQATTSNERVHVRVAQDNRDVVVEVRDHGPGIAPGDEERIFEPFFTTQIHGTGLGLAVARRAVEGHGGSLHAVSSATGGAVFQIRLPKHFVAMDR
jgi:two-component system, NtrC family, sensor histidine kinase HydH